MCEQEQEQSEQQVSGPDSTFIVGCSCAFSVHSC